MSRWFRHYAGTMSDPKFGGAARVCKRSRAEVLFVWGCLLESCAEYNSEVYSFDADAMADLLDIESEHAQSIHDALEQKGLLSGGKIVSWGRRQFTSDDSTQRVRAHRQRQKTATPADGNADETLHVTSVTPPDTETEADTSTIAKALVLVAPKSASKPKASKRCPESWLPSEADLAVAAGEGFMPGEIDRELAKIRDFEFATARADWSAVFRNWIRRAAETRPLRQGQSHERPDQPSRKLTAKLQNMASAERGLEIALARRQG